MKPWIVWTESGNGNWLMNEFSNEDDALHFVTSGMTYGKAIVTRRCELRAVQVPEAA